MHEGDFVMTRSVACLFPKGRKITYRAPAGKVIVLAAIEVADMKEQVKDIEARAWVKIKEWSGRKDPSEFPELPVDIGSLIVPMEL